MPPRVHGLLLPMARRRSAQTEIARAVWFTIDPAALARQLPCKLHSLILQITPRAGMQRSCREYTPQRFGFAAAALFGGVALALRASGGGKSASG